MDAFGSKLKRRIWQPFLLLAGVAVAASLCFTFLVFPTPLLLWSYTILFVLLVLVIGGLLVRGMVSRLRALGKLAEEISPGSLAQAARHQDEITGLTETISSITTEMREKEQTWIGDLERRNRAVQQLSRNLQEQAASFETALNSVDLAVCLFAANGNIVQVNQKFSRLLNISPEALKPLTLLQVASELRKVVEKPEALTKAAEAIYRQPAVPSDTTFSLQERAGNLRLYCVPIFGELSSLIGVIVSTGEGTDASAVERLKGEFISTVSHELRTPLTAIKGAVGLVMGGACGPVPGPIRDLLEIASHNTDRLIGLVNDILEIFRMETGRLKLQPTPSRVEDLVQRACQKTEKEAAAAKIRVETRISPAHLAVLADPEQVNIVLEKLLSNAVKFSKEGSVVRIGAEPLPDNPKLVLLWVQDFGSGILPEAQERIFEKFEQAEDVLTRQHQGSGLGLAICRGIVEGHGGRIWVKSEIGKGSTFYVSLPLAESAPPPSDVPTVVAPAVSGVVHRLIMVVDDDPDTRSVISRMLQSEGHFVVEVGQGSQVTDLALRHRPEVITLDMFMPGMNGLEVLRSLMANEKTRAIPVICVSISEELASQAKQLGAAQFIRKPLEASTLLRAIQEVCQGRTVRPG